MKKQMLTIDPKTGEMTITYELYRYTGPKVNFGNIKMLARDIPLLLDGANWVYHGSIEVPVRCVHPAASHQEMLQALMDIGHALRQR